MTTINGTPYGLTAATRRPGTPPPLEYYATRIKLGMPSHAAALAITCPWCGSGPGEPCYVRATGRRAKHPHEARTEVTP